MRKVLKDIPTGFLLIISLSLAFFVAFNSINLYVGMAREKASLTKYRYSSTVDINAGISDNQIPVFFELFDYLGKINDADVTIHKVYIFVNEEITNYIAEIVFTDEEDEILLGETIAKHLKVKDGDKIKLMGETCNVSGIRENNSSAGIDKTVSVNWKNCSAALKEKLIRNIFCEYGCTVLVKSDYDISAVLDDISEAAENMGMYAFVDEIKLKTDEENEWNNTLGKIFLGISLIFSFAVVISTSELWVKKRSREAAILITYGFSVKKVKRVFIRDVFVLCLFAILPSFLFTITYIKAFSIVNNLFKNPFDTFLLFAAFVMLAIIIVSVKISKEFKSYSIIETLGRCRCD